MMNPTSKIGNEAEEAKLVTGANLCLRVETILLLMLNSMTHLMAASQ